MSDSVNDLPVPVSDTVDPLFSLCLPLLLVNLVPRRIGSRRIDGSSDVSVIISTACLFSTVLMRSSNGPVT